MFSFFYNDKFDFLKIYDSIKHFYPIGLPKGQDKMFYSYPGIKELEKIVLENIHENDNYIDRWVDFTKQIENIIQKEIIGTTYGQAPSFSSFARLDTFSFDNFTREKELHFFVSLVGPFYTVIGQDKSVIKVGEKVFRNTNYVVVSPKNEFAETFNLLCDKIEKQFQGFRFVPFYICNQPIEGLYVDYADGNLNSVFHGLFNNNIDLNAQTLGDESYKSKDWIKEGYIDTGDKWTVYPPKQK
jgi:hypothetical protein